MEVRGSKNSCCLRRRDGCQSTKELRMQQLPEAASPEHGYSRRVTRSKRMSVRTAPKKLGAFLEKKILLGARSPSKIITSHSLRTVGIKKNTLSVKSQNFLTVDIQT
ncbi:hypothetical protein TNCV_4019631 [Trichonephila clavipes]|nr:hypothetical protein TNCV_4019631 [Trichonephila clavipes]